MNPLALRVKGMMNWPSNVRHPLLTEYLKHIFQHSIVGAPAIRASTTRIWANVTLLATPKYDPQREHPLLRNAPTTRLPTHGASQTSSTLVKIPLLNFSGAEVEAAPGRLERRTIGRSTKHKFYKPMFGDGTPSSMIAALGGNTNPLAALHIYRNTPIELHVNVIRNPLLRADIMAEYVARSLNSGSTLPRMYKEFIAKLG
eukprot:jgi/Hompol1/3723/HPOL_003338-RA